MRSLLKALGAALGELEYSFSRHEGKGTTSAWVALTDLPEVIGEVYKAYTGSATISEVGLGEFWMEYALRRWHIPRNYMKIATNADQHQRQEFAKMLGAAIGNAQKEFGGAEKDSKKAFYLHGSWRALEDIAKRFRRSCPLEEQRELVLVILRAAMETLNPGGSIGEIDFSGDLY